MSEADFRARSKKAVEEAVKAEIAKAVSSLDTKIAAMQRKVESQELDVKAADSSVKQRRLETLATGGSAVIGMLSGRKRSISSTLSKNRMASAAKDRLEAEETTLKQYLAQLEELKNSKLEVENEVREKWEGIAEEISEVTIKPTKSDIFSDIFAVAWLPYYIVEVDGKKLELPAFKR